jgi:hypothetical protein
MKFSNTFLFFIFLLFFSSLSFAGQNQYSEKPKRTSFKSGEKLTYKLHYGIISGGNATLTVDEKSFDDKKVFYAKVFAKTTGLTNTLFPIEDSYESYFDKKSGLPYKAVRNISEGGYKYYSEDFFSVSDSTVKNKKHGRKKIPANTFDMVSSLYYLRNIDVDTLHNGDILNFTTWFDDEIFPFYLRYKGKEIVETKFGKIRCLRFDPIVEPGRIFKSEDDMSFWITDDENLVPVLIEFDLIVGSVKCELIDYKNVKTNIRWD